MKHIQGRGLVLSLLMLIVIPGRSQQQPLTLAGQIAGTDRVVVSSEAYGYRLILTNEDVGKLVALISSAKQREGSCKCIFDSQVDFFRGANWLGVISCLDNDFLTDRDMPSYHDETGILKTYYDKWTTNMTARLDWTARFVADLRTNSRLFELQGWCQEALQQPDLLKPGTNQWGVITTESFPSRLKTALPDGVSGSSIYVMRGQNGSRWLNFGGGSGGGLLVGLTNQELPMKEGFVANHEALPICCTYIANAIPGVYVF